MKNLTALPAWWGLLMIVIAGMFAFPAILHIAEGHNSLVWEIKIQEFGLNYSLGILIWSYFSLILSAFFAGTGLQILLTSDPKANEK